MIKKGNASVDTHDQSQKGAVQSLVIADVSSEASVQYVCIVCKTVLNSNEEQQSHMLLHGKQENMAYVIRDFVQGNTAAVTALKTMEITQQPSTTSVRVVTESEGLTPRPQSDHSVQ